jgi:predicted secreted protein
VPSLTVRITRESHKTLRSMAKQSGVSMQVLLEEAVEELRRKRFFREFNAAYRRLRSKPTAWKEEQRERRMWEGTLGDGLGD